MKNFSACLTLAAGLSLAASAHDVDDPFKEMVRSQPPVPPHAGEGLVSQSAVLAALRKDVESGSDEAKYLLSVVTTGHPDGPTDLQLIESDQDFLILTLYCGAGQTKWIYEFGMRSLLGIGFARDPATAAYWFGRAAEEGNALAIFTMGRLAE